MSISVHTNKSALVALQNLNKTNDELSDVQNRINTGLSIANAKDNASVWSIAQGQRADILDGTTTSIRFLANADANAYITLSGQDMSLGGAIITIAPTASINTVADAQQALTDLDASIGNVNQALGALGAQAKQIENHNKFVSKLTDVLQAGIGNLVDADVAKESAHLQALQVQQQLGAQALSIANQAPQIILSLFK